MLNSRATLASAALLTAGSIAWYSHLYGGLPFLGEVHASSPSEAGLHPAAYPWPHKGLFDSFDHARCASNLRTHPLPLTPSLPSFFPYAL